MGYDLSWVSDRSIRLATVGLGYADGLPLAASNILELLLGGHACPVRGSVSMDSVVVEVGREKDVKAGDQAWVIGTGQRAEQVALTLNTIPHEIVSRISRRVDRV